jgi:hypothetical protein
MNPDLFLKDVRDFERGLRLWPYVRPLMKRFLTRRCGRCVLSERHGPLNQDGLCAACAAHVPSSVVRPDILEGPNPFDALMAEAGGAASGRYDAVLLVSGGKDSAYLLHRLRRDHPRLRLLTVLVSNGFMSPVALANVAELRGRFHTEHIDLHPAPQVVKSVFHWGLTHLHRQSGYSLVDLLDGQMTFDAALNLAAAMGIPYVIAGLAKTQLENVFGPVTWEWPRDGRDMPAAVGCSRLEAYADPERSFWYHPERWPEARRPRFLTPFVAWDPSESFLLAEVARLGLLPPKRSSPLITNNALIPVIGLAEVARFGFSSFEVEFAREVRAGKSQRTAWLHVFEMLEYASRTGRFLGAGARATLAELNLTFHDLGI